MIDEQLKEQLRTKTVETLLAVRAVYLGTPGANMLKHWDQIQERMRAAARTTASPEEWATKLCRDLQLPALGSTHSSILKELVDCVTENSCRNEWLDLLEQESGYLMALARLVAEQRKEEREAKEQKPKRSGKKVDLLGDVEQ